jgi:uncharacterized membrane protein YkoI
MLVVVLALATATRAIASDREHDEPERDERESVRAAVERGELKSLAEVLQSVRPKLPGEVLGIEIEREQGLWIYEFRIVDDKGRLFDVYVDAATAKILKTKEK